MDTLYISAVSFDDLGCLFFQFRSYVFFIHSQTLEIDGNWIVLQLCNGNSYKSIIAGLGLVALKQAQDVGMSADLTRGPRPREAVHDKWIMWIKWIKSRGEVEGNRTQLLHEFDGLTSTARASISESFSILFAKVTVG